MAVDYNALLGSRAEAAMLDGLRNLVEDNLRKMFREAAEEIVEQAVRDAMQTFEARITSYVMQDADMSRILKIIVEYPGKKENLA